MSAEPSALARLTTTLERMHAAALDGPVGVGLVRSVLDLAYQALNEAREVTR